MARSQPKLFFLLLPLLLIQGLLPQVAGYKYWLHSSCSSIPSAPGQTISLDNVMKSVFQWGKSTARRMDEMDLASTGWKKDLAHAYSYIFSDNPKSSRTVTREWEWREHYPDKQGTDTVFNIVRETMRSMGEDWAETNDYLHSDVRIYCDDGRHYDYGDDLWYRSWSNNMKVGVNCHAGPGELLGFTTRERIDNHAEDNGDVALITICDAAFQTARSLGRSSLPMPATMSDLYRNKKVRDGASIDRLNPIAHTVFHEANSGFGKFMHAWQYLHEDHGESEPDNDAGETGGWEQAMYIEDEESPFNAESYTFLAKINAVMEGFRDRNKGTKKYALDREYQTDISKLAEGIIREYDDL